MNTLLNWFGIAAFRGNVVMSSFDLFAIKQEFVFRTKIVFPFVSPHNNNINSNFLMDNAYNECYEY